MCMLYKHGAKPQVYLKICAGGVAFACAQLFRHLCLSGWGSKNFHSASDTVLEMTAAFFEAKL